MKITETLYESALDLWNEAAEKPFVTEMAKGSLDEGLFCRYMIQDYLYLLEYIDTLRLIQSRTEDAGLRAFMDAVIAETENETYRVHVPHMQQLGVSEEEARRAARLPVIPEYLGYMQDQVRGHGMIAGLTALLQCSWLYAYIGEKAVSKYADEIEKSRYKFWFNAYTCREYHDANQMWIDVLDRETEGISPGTAAMLKEIFLRCAEFENRLWDELYKKP